MAGMSSLVRIVNAGVPGSQDRVDVVLRDGGVASVGPAGTVSASDSTMQTKAHTTSLEYATNAIASGSVSIPTSAAAPVDETTIDADGLWVIPGLWDCHTHFTQWAKTLGRLDLINARSAAEAMDMLRRHLDERRAADTLDPDAFVVGMRFRHSLWADDEQPTLAAIDAVTGEQPVALSSADMHCGWVNSAAARRLGVHVDESGLVGELEWFNAYTAFDKAPGAAEETDRLLREAEQDAASKGVVGIRDYEMAENIDTWINRFAAGINGLRVDAGVYPERLRAAIDAGWHTGKELPGSAGLGHVGAMKLISDGSLNTRSAYCSTPYSGIEPLTYGTLSYTPQQIEDYMRLATEHGFDIACHAIGDEANTIRSTQSPPRTHMDRSSMRRCSNPSISRVSPSWGSRPASSRSTPWMTATSSPVSGPTRPASLIRSGPSTTPVPRCAWARMRPWPRWTRGWPFPPPCSAPKALTASRSSPSSASMCIPRWQPRPPLAVTALHPATRPMWCCWTPTHTPPILRKPCALCRNTS